jgi:hypothetical protein
VRDMEMKWGIRQANRIPFLLTNWYGALKPTAFAIESCT